MKIYHDANEDGSWTRISAIIQFPIPVDRMDETAEISFVIRDFEGVLYAAWEAYDWIPIKVEDESTKILFRGFLTRKKYNMNSLHCIARGLSAKLDWTPVNRNYKYKEGTVKTVPHAGDDTIELQDSDGDAITWENDELINGQDLGIIIRDTSENWTTVVYTTTAVNTVGAFSTAGNFNGMTTRYDGIYYQANDKGLLDTYITPTISGANIDSTSEKLKEIRIEINMRSFFAGWFTYQTAAVEILYNGTDWITLKSRKGYGTDIFEATAYYTITLTGTDTELAKYMHKTGDNYDRINNIRISLTSTTSTGENISYLKIDYAIAYIKHYETDITPITEAITDNGPSWVECSGIDFTASGVVGESVPGEKDGDSFMVGFATHQILYEIFGACGVGLQIDSTLTKFMAQRFKGTNAKEVLNKIKLLEGVHWFEDHVLNQVRIAKEADFVDSTESLTQADYLDEWEFEDDNNYYSAVEVFGSAGYNIYYKAIDPAFPVTNKSPMTKTIIEETIMTVAEARDVAEAELLELKVKRPSIKIPLKGTYTDIRVGTTVALTLAKPTVGIATYPIRMTQRQRLGHGDIKTIIYCGLGHSTLEEKVTDRINKALYLAHKAHTDRLVSTNFAPGVMPAFGDVSGIVAGVEAIITAELVDGQSIDLVIDSLVAAAVQALIDTDVWVKNAGDIMSGDLKIDKATPLLTIDAASGIATAVLISTGEEDTRFKWRESSDAYGFTWVYDGGTNKFILYRHDNHAAFDVPVMEFERTTGNAKFIRPLDMNSQKITSLAKGTAANDALALGSDRNLSDVEYDGDAWNNKTDVAPSQNAVRDVVEFLATCLLYKGTWTPSGESYPEEIVIDLTDEGYTVNATKTFKDDDATFETDLVAVGDYLWIQEDTFEGMYYIESIDSETQVTVTRAAGNFTATANLDYEIFRAVIGDFYIADADGYVNGIYYENGDYILWNGTQWDRLRNSFGDNIIAISPGDPIQIAIDEVESVGEGAIVLLPGTHNITSELDFGDILATVNLTFRGCGDVSILKTVGDIDATDVNNCGSITFKDFKLDCSSMTTPGNNGLDINCVNNGKVIVENVTIYDDGGIADAIQINSDNVIVRNCHISGVRYGIYGIAAHKAKCYENVIYDCNSGGIYFNQSDYCTITDNNIDGNAENSSYGIRVNDSQHITVTINTVDDCDRGVYIQGQSDRGTYIGNTVINCSNVGIDVDVGDHNSVTANVIHDCGDGIQLGANASNNYITANMLENNVKDIDDNSDGTNYILSKDYDTSTVMLAVWSNIGSQQVQYYVSCEFNQGMVATFSTDETIDVSRDITFRINYSRSDAGGAEVDVNWWVEYFEHGGVAKLAVPNFDNDSYPLPGVPQSRFDHITLTIPGGSLPQNATGWITALNAENDANDVLFYPIAMTYYQKKAGL